MDGLSRQGRLSAAGQYDATLFVAALTLTALGTLLVVSTTGKLASGLDAEAPLRELRHQLGLLSMGGLAFCVALKTPAEWLRKWAPVLAAFCVALLVGVALFGKTTFGARRWFDLGFITIQPSEFAKIGFAIYVAHSLARPSYQDIGMQRVLGPAALFLIMALLLVKQPDVGSAVLLAALLVSMLVASGMGLKVLLLTAVAAGVGILGVILLQSEKIARFVGWLYPEATRMGEGYQVYQAQILIGSGGLTGAGLGSGLNHGFGYLPQSANDFIFSVAAEELGFVGVCCLVLLYAVLAVRGFAIAYRCRDEFARYAAFAMTVLLVLPAWLHMAVNLGLLPTKGLVLPFVSYGGTAMAASGAALGILERLHLEATAVTEGAA